MCDVIACLGHDAPMTNVIWYTALHLKHVIAAGDMAQIL